MKLIQKLRSSMAFNIIGSIIIVLLVFGILVSTLGYFIFTDTFKREYSTTTYHMADTAASLVNGDHLDDYLEGREQEEYQYTRELLQGYCLKMNVTMVYVILVDRSDYGRFVSVFNPINNAVDNSEYTEWELGHERDTTNDEYRSKYQAVYEQKVPYETVYRIKTTDGQHSHITTLVPIIGSDGNVSAILCMQRPFSELFNAARPYLIVIAAATIILAALASIFIALFIRKQFVNPVRKITKEATRFSKENTIGEPLGSVSRIEEISDLAGSIDTMEHDMVSYIDNLTAVTAENERIGTEMALASRIQSTSVPNTFPPFPDRKEFDIYASMTPAKEVGGDFYNFYWIDEDHLAVVIGDVSGKGIPGALFMMVTNILTNQAAQSIGRPAEILAHVNEDLCKHNRVDMFVTLWLGILDTKTGRIVAANAGHEYPAIQHGGEFSLLKDKHGFVLGGMPGMKYTEYEIMLSPGDKLFVYTDGIPEATNSNKGLLGTDRMIDILNKDSSASPEGIINNIYMSIDEFVGEAEQFDDITMLCLEYKGKDDQDNEH